MFSLGAQLRKLPEETNLKLISNWVQMKVYGEKDKMTFAEWQEKRTENEMLMNPNT